MRKSDALKALSKSQAEIQLWKSRFETEGMDALRSLSLLATSSSPRLLRMKNLLMFSPPRLPMLRSQREDLVLTLMISPWSTREFMLLLLSLRSVQRTLTRSLVNGSPRLLILELRLLPPRMRDATTLLSSSV